MTTRVAIVCPHLAAGLHGGVERVARWLHDALAEHPSYDPVMVSVATSRHDADSVRVLAPRTWAGGPRVSEHDLDGTAVRHVGAWAVEAEPMRYLPRGALSRVLATADLVQVVAGTPAFGLAASRSGRPLCLQVATTVAAERPHEDADRPGLRRLLDTTVGRLERRALAAADHVLVENAWMLDEVRRSSRTPVSLAPPGVDDAWFAPAGGSAGGPAGAGDHLLAVCRLSSTRKNLEGLLRSHAAGGGAVLPLVLAGAGPAPPDLVRLAEELGTDVRWVVDPEDTALRELYRGARALVLASHEEGLGLVCLEALACGTPVVATATAGAREVLGRGAPGDLVPCFRGTSSSLTQVLVARSREPLTPAVRAEARRVAVREFGREASLGRFTDVYGSLT